MSCPIVGNMIRMICTLTGNVYPCEIYESINAQIVSEKSIAIITRASVTNQTQVCGADAMTCPRTYSDSSEEFRFNTAQSERFTILFDHAVTASQIRLSSVMRGRSGLAATIQSSTISRDRDWRVATNAGEAGARRVMTLEPMEGLRAGGRAVIAVQARKIVAKMAVMRKGTARTTT